jgi:DNA polymerase-3 subunit delta
MAQKRAKGADFQQLRRELADGTVLPVYVLEGEDTVRIRGVVDYLVKHQLGETGAAFNYHVYDGDDCGVEAPIQQALSYPMMAAHQIVWVKRADQLCSGADDEEGLSGYLEKPPKETILILSANKFDGRKKWLKHVKASGWHYDLSPPTGRDLHTWVERAARERTLAMDPDTAALLVELVGEDCSALGHELDKLAAAVSDLGGMPDSEQLQQLILSQRPVDPFELLGALGPGSEARGLAVYHRYLAEGRSAFELAPLIVWRVKQAAQVAALLSEGYGERQLAGVLGASPFAVQQAVSVVRTWGTERVERAMRVAHRVDGQLKGSPIPPETVLEQAILEICS